jgi:hypothetical protein
MRADILPTAAQIAIRVLVATLRNPDFILSKDERIELEGFIADLQDALNDEAERQWLDRQSEG